MKRAEEWTVSQIDKAFEKHGRVLYNNRGDRWGKNKGRPDFDTLDDSGRFLAIEAKSSVGKAHPNQLRNARRILKAGGRYVIAYPDFDYDAVMRGEIPVVTYIDEDTKTGRATCEIVLGGDA